MRRPPCWPLVGVLLTTWGCGGPEFVAESGSSDAGADTSVTSDAAAGDGAVPGDATASTDGRTPDDGAGLGDGGTGAKDAATDASDAGFSCASQAATVVFCSDFDEQATPPWNWAGAPTNTNGTDSADTTDYLSAPNGFASTTAADLTGSEILAYLTDDFSSLAGRIDYQFAMYVKSADSVVSIPIADLVVGPQTTSALSLEIVLEDGELHFTQIFTGADGGSQSPTVTIGAVSTGAWVHVDMLLDRSATNWTVSFAIDGATKLVAQTATTPANQDLEIDLGMIGVVPPSTANAITFDNVLVRAY